MALLFMDGFDAQQASTVPGKWSTFGGAATYQTGSTLTRFNYGASLQCSGNTDNRVKFYGATATAYIGMAIRAGSTTGDSMFMTIYGDNGTTAHLTLKNVGGTLNLYRGGSLIASSPAGAFPGLTWLYMELMVVIHDSTGRFVAKFNGVTVIDFTGDTKNGGTATTSDTLMIRSGDSGGGPFQYDDLYICDGTGSAPYNTYLGDVRIAISVPTAAGATTGFTPSTGANYAAVDEIPMSATDYVTGTTSGTKDTYACTDLPATASSVLAVQLNAIAKKSDAGALSLKTVVRTGGTDYADAGSALGTSDAVVSRILTANPGTAAAWTVSEVNAAEIGVQVA